MAGLLLPGAAVQARSASTESIVPRFNPRDYTVNLDRNAGSEWPDERELLAAFRARFSVLEACVSQAKLGRDTRIEGEARLIVLLNPAGRRPLAAVEDMPDAIAAQAWGRELGECLRVGTGTGYYPGYDGPPLVVHFDFEIDPGYEVEIE